MERKEGLEEYRWSSHRVYAGAEEQSVVPWLCLDWLSHFGRTRRTARREYHRQIDQMFGQMIASPLLCIT